ncbi:hypothetical protein QE422_002603 [Chryseobacterium sp. SORGH_AS 447]|uniref:hypothetical protein n=1 Tax=Chryseobacterium sp. SORGH_AS_0447 TaxID=3041769 RepID=UPI0027892412|nr:hypothetical protein [Chryseobacterium sp. SORGH_AS_0447]MDQ1162235.1 hypothetical protein [Chryseobacterium sp. SORGH_AS_0447]
MKTLMTILGLVLLISCKKEHSEISRDAMAEDRTTIRNTKNPKTDKSIETIEDIKKEYAYLNTLLISKKLDSSSFTYNCTPTGREGSVVFYYLDKKLRMVKNLYSENSHFSSSTEYFIKDHQPFFIYNEETSWSFDDGGTPEKPETKDDVEEKRFYYINNRLESCRDKKYTIRNKNHSGPENVSDGESKNCNDTELMKTFQVLLKKKDEKGELQCF